MISTCKRLSHERRAGQAQHGHQSFCNGCQGGIMGGEAEDILHDRAPALLLQHRLQPGQMEEYGLLDFFESLRPYQMGKRMLQRVAAARRFPRDSAATFCDWRSWGYGGGWEKPQSQHRLPYVLCQPLITSFDIDGPLLRIQQLLYEGPVQRVQLVLSLKEQLIVSRHLLAVSRQPPNPRETAARIRPAQLPALHDAQPMLTHHDRR